MRKCVSEGVSECVCVREREREMTKAKDKAVGKSRRPVSSSQCSSSGQSDLDLVQ